MAATLFARHGGMGMGDDMDMGSMSPGNGVPGYFYMQKMFWVVIGSIIAFATLVNLFNKALLWERLRSSNAKPTSLLSTCFATGTAICREISHASVPSYHFRGFVIRCPSLGKVINIGSYFVVILVFCFYKYDVVDQWSWENIAYRAGCIAQAQLPLIFLLAGKQNIIGALTGTGYEKLNYLHRWVARILWVTVTIHMSFWFRSWARYEYILIKLRTDQMTQTGFAAWCILTFIVGTSFAPVRHWNYELFVLLHLVSFAGLIGAIMIHVDDGKIYVWIPIGLYFLDRLLRAGTALLLNLNLLRGTSISNGGLWAKKATLTTLPGGVTRISISSTSKSWNPGQHMFLSCHSILPLQSHPFTIASIPSDRRIDFIVKARRGGTKRYLDYAAQYERLPDTERDPVQTRRVAVEGPYGQIRPLHQFDSVVLFAGSTGATFTVPLMRDIVRRRHSALPAVTRHVRFVWAIKSGEHMSWFGDQFSQLLKDTTLESGLELELSVYVTCDESLEARANSQACVRDVVKIVDSCTDSSSEEAEKNRETETVEVRSVNSESDLEGGACGKDGKCCCRATVEDEKDAPICCCSKPPPSSSTSRSRSSPNVPSSPGWASDPRMKLLSGRPHPRTIIRKVLEEAEGESAVVVCGPQGLQDDVRRSVVALSDERAVHKGTGAQGIYLHAEGFCY